MNKLICKSINLPIKKNLYSGRVKPHPKAKSYDLVKLIANDKKIDILTFRDESIDGQPGKILRRYIFEKNRLGKLVTKKDYIDIKNSNKNITSRKVSTITTFDNEFWNKTEEIQVYNRDAEVHPSLFISKIKSRLWGKEKIEEESQSLFEYKKGFSKKGYEVNSIIRTKDSFLNDIIEPVYNFYGFYKNIAKSFKKDPYFLLHLYSFKQFKKIAPFVAASPNRSPELNFDIKWFSNNEKTEKLYGFFNEKINLSKKFLNNRLQIINTSAHEKEHGYQLEQAIFYGLKFNKPLEGIVSPQTLLKYCDYHIDNKLGKIADKIEAKMFYDDFKNYISALDNEKVSSEQFVELCARVAGADAEEKYVKSAMALKMEFPFAPNYLIGFSNKDKILKHLRLKKK